MKFHASTRFFVLVVVILILTVSAAWAAGGDGPGDAAGIDPAGVAVDFERVVQTPEGLQKATLRALAGEGSRDFAFDHYTVTVLETADTWAHLVLIPTRVLDSNWELPLGPDDPIDVIAHLEQSGAWEAVIKSEASLPWLQATVPGDFMDFSPAEPAEAFLFPWTSGQSWRVSQTWHSSAIDFFPLRYSNPPIDGAALAMGAGTLSQVCNDGSQAHLRIDHGDVTSGYLHLDASTVREHDLNQAVPRGRFLGLIYNGNAFFDPNPYCAGRSNLQYSTPCGCGTGAHVHFSSTDTGITVDGHNLGAVGSSQGTYVSSNVRDEGPPPPAPEVTTVVSRPALTPEYSAACGSGWEKIDGYQGNPAYVTLNTNDVAQSTNSGLWTPNLPQEGRYQVAAFIPNHSAVYWDCSGVNRTISADTSDARYQVTHTGGTTTVAGDQGPLADQWLPLGTFRFQQGTAGRVRLTDLNGEENLSRTVSFSAMRFVMLPPDRPAGLSASDAVYGDRVRLTWNAALGAAGYDVYRAPSSSGTPSKIGSTSSLVFSDSSATPGVVYHYSVRAVNPAGAGPFSATDPGARSGPYAMYLPVTGR